MRFVSLLALVALGAGSASAADTAPPPSKPAAQQASVSTTHPSDLDRVICRSEQATGTRLPTKKECHTKREWDDLAVQTRQALDANAAHQQGVDTH